jgi:hypothetical protein
MARDSQENTTDVTESTNDLSSAGSETARVAWAAYPKGNL